MTTTKKQQKQPPIKQSVKQHYSRYGEYRLNFIDRAGHKIWARTNTVKGVLALIAHYRSLNYKHIEVWEPSRTGVTQLWDVQETKVVS
jgi:hypothetical protein